MPSPVGTVTADVRLEAWRGAPYHTFNLRLMTGAAPTFPTLVTADAMTEEPAPDDPLNAIIRHYSWTTSVTALSAFKFRMDGTTDNVLTTFHVAERLDVDTP